MTRLAACSRRNAIFRIDHYLGKETVQNLTALRFGNTLFEPLWNSSYIDHVQITVAETVGVEWRAPYYDGAGALRDMVQNHLLQLLCLVAIEPPASLHADAMRDEKLKVLRALTPLTGEHAARNTVRGQYVAGSAKAKRYAATSRTSVARLRAPTPSSRCMQKSPTGAGLACRSTCAPASAWRHARSEIVVTFREMPHSIFQGGGNQIAPNQLVLRLQPDEGVKLWLMMKAPGPAGCAAPRADGHELRRDLRRAPPGRLRAPADGRGARQSRCCSCAATKWKPRGAGSIRSCTPGARHSERRSRTLPAARVRAPRVALIERDGRTWHEEPWT